jgi:alpha-1,3-mannosyltransferase
MTGCTYCLQYIFGALYLTTQALVMAAYIAAAATPPWALVLLTLSKRIHSIYILRLFNDCWAAAGAYAAVLLLCRSRWAAAIVVFSAAVSIKMNVLLMAPAVLVICLLVRNSAC